MLLLDYRYHRDNIISKLPGWLRDRVRKLNTLHSAVSSIEQVLLCYCLFNLTRLKVRAVYIHTCASSTYKHLLT